MQKFQNHALFNQDDIVKREDLQTERLLPESNEFMGYDLSDAKQLHQCIHRIHHNTGSKSWLDLRKHLLMSNVPKLVYQGLRVHCKDCDRIQLRARRPLSRPARFPMATAPFEITMMDFFEYVIDGDRKQTHVILHTEDVFARFSVLRYCGKKN